MADPKQRYEEIIAALKANGQKLTPQRLAIVDILAVSEGHPGVEMIYERLKKNFPTMSLATVYRNVLLIKSLNQVLELGFPDHINRYDGNKPHPHPHLICTRCRAIMDPELSSLVDMSQEIADETGFKIHSHRLDFFGLCPKCQSSQKK